MFCPTCGQQVPDGSTFCTHCGASLKAGGATPPTGGPTAAPAPAAAPGSSFSPDVTQAMPPVTPAPQKPKSKAPIIVIAACAAVVLIGAGTVFALTAFNNSNNGSGTQISKVDTGSSEEKASTKKTDTKKKSSKDASSDDDAVPENESNYYADKDAGSADSDTSLNQVHTWRSDLNDYSMSIPDRFEETTAPGKNSSMGATYTDPDTGFVINLYSRANPDNDSAGQLLDRTDTSGKDDLYTAEDSDWYVVSWREGDTIYYEKTIVSSRAIATASLQYSTSDRDMGSQLIDSLLPTLKFD